MKENGHEIYIRSKTWHRFVEEAQKQRLSVSSWMRLCCEYCIGLSIDFREALKSESVKEGVLR